MMDTYLQLISQLSLVEAIAFVTGIAYVVLAAKENAWCWLFGGINVVLIFWLSYPARLYADMGLQVVYLGLTFYGAYQWLKKPDLSDTARLADQSEQQAAIPITNTKAKTWLSLLAISVIVLAALWFILQRFTDTDVPFVDAFTTTGSLLATYMVAKKKLENWLVWIVIDCVYIFLYRYKALPLLSLLSIVYTVLAVVGYFNWMQLKNKADSTIAP